MIDGLCKLQGYKALNNQHAQLKIDGTVKEFNTFPGRLSSKDISELGKKAQDRALDIINRPEQQKRGE